MKFDYIIGNPPYLAGVHVKIFNRCFGMLQEEAELAFIQPGIAYFNKGKNVVSELKKMMEIIRLNYSSVRIVGSETFQGAEFSTDLSISTIRKTQDSFDGVNKVEYRDGGIYKSTLCNVNMFDMAPDIYKSIRSKYQDYINKNGSISKRLSEEMDANGAKIAYIRGHLDQKTGDKKSDYYTFYSKNDSKSQSTGRDNFRIECKENENDNIHHYLDTKIARFGFALMKYGQVINRSTLKMVPDQDFSKRTNDSVLKIELGITDSEFKEICKVIPDYIKFDEIP